MHCHRTPTHPFRALLHCSLFEQVRQETAVEEPMLSVEYLKGSNALLAKACGFTDAAQLACT